MIYLLNYIVFALAEGDWLNDWVTHLSPWLMHLILSIVSTFNL